MQRRKGGTLRISIETENPEKVKKLINRVLKEAKIEEHYPVEITVERKDGTGSLQLKEV